MFVNQLGESILLFNFSLYETFAEATLKKTGVWHRATGQREKVHSLGIINWSYQREKAYFNASSHFITAQCLPLFIHKVVQKMRMKETWNCGLMKCF